MQHRSSHLSRYPDRDKLFAAMKENGQEKPDLSVFPTWMQQAWAQLRSAFLIGAVIIGAYAAYREAFPAAQPVTVEQITESNADTRMAFAAIADSTMRAALATYTDSLQQVQQNLEDSVAKPIYKAIIDLDRRTSRIERRMVEAGMALEEQRQTTAATTAQLMDKLSDRSDLAALMDAFTRMEERMDDRMDAIEQRLPKSKTSRFKAE